MKSKLSILFLLLLSYVYGYAQEYHVTEAAEPQGKTIVFKFVADNDMFYIPYQGNGDKLQELFATIDHYKALIVDGTVKINVAGYCSSYATKEENIRSAAIRANRVKSELIVHNGIKEADFATTVHASSYEGRKSVVVVTLRIPQIQTVVEDKPAVVEQKNEAAPEVKVDPQPESKPDLQPVAEEPKPIIEQPATHSTTTPTPFTTWDNYRFALRTNLLYDALLMPNLGLEWRVNENWGVKFDAGGSSWGSETGKVQKLWFVNPEVRYYMGNARRFYVGVGGNYAKYNIYKGVPGSLISKDTGYQGSMWNAGATVGYQLPLGRSFALDFNLGLGYNSFSYDTFELIGDTRVYKDRDQSKNFFGATQAGISLVWKFVK